MQSDFTTNIGDVLRFIRRGLLLAMLVAITAGVVAYLSSSRLPRTYRSLAVIAVSRDNSNREQSNITPPLSDSAYRVAATSDTVLTDTLNTLGIPLGATEEEQQRTITTFRRKVRVTTVGGQNYVDPSSLINIEVSNPSAKEAANQTGVLANALINWDRNRGRDIIQEQVDSLQNQIDELSNQIRILQANNQPQQQIDNLIQQQTDLYNQYYRMQALSNAAIGTLSFIQPAAVPLEPVAPRPVFNTALAFLLGLIASYGILLLRNALDMRLRDVEDLAKVSDLPVLASFPKLATESRRLPYEATSYLRTNLLFSTSDAHPKVIVVTSARETEGKSSVALSLAESFVRNNYRTLLVDADMRKPVIAGEYRINSLHQTSLESWLKNPYGSNQAASVPINGKYYLYVIPTFQPTTHAAELLSSGFRECLEIWRKEYDVIILDSAPVLAVADTLTIAPLSTGSVLVVNQQKTDRRQVRAAVDILRRIGVRVSGVVATHVTRESSQGTGYGYGYSYGFQEVDAKQPVIPETVTATKLSKTKR